MKQFTECAHTLKRLDVNSVFLFVILKDVSLHLFSSGWDVQHLSAKSAERKSLKNKPQKNKETPFPSTCFAESLFQQRLSKCPEFQTAAG